MNEDLDLTKPLEDKPEELHAPLSDEIAASMRESINLIGKDGVLYSVDKILGEMKNTGEDVVGGEHVAKSDFAERTLRDLLVWDNSLVQQAKEELIGGINKILETNLVGGKEVDDNVKEKLSEDILVFIKTTLLK